MKFLVLTKIEGKKIAVAASAVVSVEICDDESTWVELLTGTKFLVREFSQDIVRLLDAELVSVPM